MPEWITVVVLARTGRCSLTGISPPLVAKLERVPLVVLTLGLSIQYASNTGAGHFGGTASQLTELPSVTVPPGGTACGSAQPASVQAASPWYAMRIPAGHVGQPLQPGTAARIFTGAFIPSTPFAFTLRLNGSKAVPDTSCVPSATPRLASATSTAARAPSAGS